MRALASSPETSFWVAEGRATSMRPAMNGEEGSFTAEEINTIAEIKVQRKQIAELATQDGVLGDVSGTGDGDALTSEGFLAAGGVLDHVLDVVASPTPRVLSS
jgi:hypothetical protein